MWLHAKQIIDGYNFEHFEDSNSSKAIGQRIILISLYITSAFDSFKWPLILEALRQKNFKVIYSKINAILRFCTMIVKKTEPTALSEMLLARQ